MAVVQHRQIEDAITKTYAPHLDMSDVKDNVPAEQRAGMRLSRGLAAFILSYLVDLDPKSSAECVVDSFGDGGIDAIRFNQADATLYLVQSKWNTADKGSIDKGDVLKFADGVKNLLNGKKERFSGKILNSWKDVDAAITQSRSVILTICYSGSGSFSPDCEAVMEALIDEIDETRELVDYQVIRQDALHSYLLQGAVGSPINAQLTLLNWGQVGSDIPAYYGQVAAADLYKIHKSTGNRLFSRNIRSFLGTETAVNKAIQKTLEDSPELFWFLNNGVTALANRVIRLAAGAGGKEAGLFDCQGLVIVNGAQTVGSISDVFKKDPEAKIDAKVPMRIISLDSAPDGFSATVTRTNNTQNRIDARNFVALDPEQERLRAEFAIDNIDYEYRQGEVESSGGNRLGLVEATIALACTQPSIELAVQAKREIGKLWEDIDRAPYKTLFNGGTTCRLIWNRTQILRRVDKIIDAEEARRDGKDAQVVTHGNRLIFHVAYHILAAHSKREDFSDIKDNQIESTVKKICDKAAAVIDKEFESSYLAVLFKNGAKCARIAAGSALTPEESAEIFPA